MRFRCREDMLFGIIYLHNPSPSKPSRPGRALKLLERSGLKDNALFATFASEATGTVQYGFNSSFQKTGEQALEMFDTALGKPVELDLLLKELQTISKGARKGMLQSWFLSVFL